MQVHMGQWGRYFSICGADVKTKSDCRARAQSVGRKRCLQRDCLGRRSYNREASADRQDKYDKQQTRHRPEYMADLPALSE